MARARRYALAAFKGGVATFLAPYPPEGDESVRDIAGHPDHPETVGRTHARLIMVARGGEKKGVGVMLTIGSRNTLDVPRPEARCVQ